MLNVIKQIYHKTLGFECAFYLILTWVFLSLTSCVSLTEYRVLTIASCLTAFFLVMPSPARLLKMNAVERIMPRARFMAFGITFFMVAFSGMECCYQVNQFHSSWQNNALFIVLMTLIIHTMTTACRKEME